MYVDAAASARKGSDDIWGLDEASAGQHTKSLVEHSAVQGDSWSQGAYATSGWDGQQHPEHRQDSHFPVKQDAQEPRGNFTFVDSGGNAFAPSFMVRVGDSGTASACLEPPPADWRDGAHNPAPMFTSSHSEAVQHPSYHTRGQAPAPPPRANEAVAMAQIGDQKYMLVPFVPGDGSSLPATLPMMSSVSSDFYNGQQQQQQLTGHSSSGLLQQHSAPVQPPPSHGAFASQPGVSYPDGMDMSMHNALSTLQQHPVQQPHAHASAPHYGSAAAAHMEQGWSNFDTPRAPRDDNGLANYSFNEFCNIFLSADGLAPLEDDHGPARLPHADAHLSNGGWPIQAAPSSHRASAFNVSNDSSEAMFFSEYQATVGDAAQLRNSFGGSALHAWQHGTSNQPDAFNDWHSSHRQQQQQPAAAQPERLMEFEPLPLSRSASQPAVRHPSNHGSTKAKRVGKSMHGGRRQAEPDGRTLVVAGVGVVVNGKARQTGFVRNGYIRKGENLGSIIRAGGPAARNQQSQQGAQTLQDKIAACKGSGDTAALSIAGGDSTHGGSTSRKRKAAAQSLAAMNLDSSHHSTGRGSARRKALTGLSTDEHIKALMGLTESPEVVEDILAWEAQQPRSGKWKGVNARQWGKVGIEIRLTGQSRHRGPFTDVGKLVARFADIVTTSEVSPEPAPQPHRHAASDGERHHASGTVSSRSTDSPRHRQGQSGAGEPEGVVSSPLVDVKQQASTDNSHSSRSQRSQPSDSRPPPALRLVWRSRGKDKAWLGTYHTPVNAAVHHDFFKVVLAVEGKIFTSRDMDACDYLAGRQRPHLLKMNFPLDELPALMRQSVFFTNLWHKYYQGSERYIFRDHDAAEVEKIVADFIAQHCEQLRNFIPATGPQDSEDRQALPRTQPRRATKAVARDSIRSSHAGETNSQDYEPDDTGAFDADVHGPVHLGDGLADGLSLAGALTGPADDYADDLLGSPFIMGLPQAHR